MIEIILKNADETKNLGKKLAKLLLPNTTILLEGNLGAGKTTLMQGIGEGLGINDVIISPTFTLINEYDNGNLPLYHFDLYRLNPTEINEIYPEIYWEGIEFTPGITAIEWADKLTYKPLNYLKIQLININENQRKATILIVGNININLDQLIVDRE